MKTESGFNTAPEFCEYLLDLRGVLDTVVYQNSKNCFLCHETVLLQIKYSATRQPMLIHFLLARPKRSDLNRDTASNRFKAIYLF